MGSKQRSKDEVQAIQSLMELVTIAAKMDTMQAIVAAMSVHSGIPKARAKTRTRKARTARTGQATTQDLWTMLDRRNNPKQSQHHLGWERSMRR